MIEVYVGLTLAGLGYILNQNRAVKSNPVKQINVNELPSSTNIYDSTYANTAKKVEMDLARKKYAEMASAAPISSSNPSTSIPRVVPKNPEAFVRSSLSGVNIPSTDFKHNNMTPFYRGALKHVRVDNPGLSQNLETFTGAQQYYKPKREVERFFQPERNLGNINGSSAASSFVQSRVEAPKIRNNTLPFEQQRVGPAINRGFTADPTGGYQQLDARDHAMPRSTDELRAANKPKVTYAGRTIDGQKGSLPGSVGAVEKNRVPTYFENNPDRYFKTTGAYLKDKQQPMVNAKYTARQDVSTKAYAGGAYQRTVGDVQAGDVTVVHKDQLGTLGVTNASLTHMPNQKGDDYGKGSIMVYDNERAVTSTRTYQGNLTSIVKSIIAPIEDLIKVTRKEFMVDAPREYGQMQATIPSALTMYDPNVPLRTTIKETVIHDAQQLNFRGAPKITVYDPNAVTRTTTKETLLHDSQQLNLKGASKITIHDPNATTRTTIKETLLHDSVPLNVKGDRAHGQVYDPEKYVPRTTVRQTVAPMDTKRNMGTSGTYHANVVHDPSDTARTTMKETTSDAPREFGNPDRGENFQGGYQGENFDAPETQRHAIAQDSDYAGNPNRQGGDAYAVVQDASVPRETQKEVIADNDYYGGAGDKTTHKQMSYEDAYNATFDDLKEELEIMTGREPTQSGVKVSSGMEDVVIQTRKIDCDIDAPRHNGNADHVVNVPLDSQVLTLTKGRHEYEEDDRLDVDILDAFKNNEFTQPLNSYI